MVWAGTYSKGKTENAGMVKKLIQRSTVLYWKIIYCPLTTMNMELAVIIIFFMRENASVHISNHTEYWFSDHDLDLLDWPA